MRANEIRLPKYIVDELVALPEPLRQVFHSKITALTYPPLKGIRLLGPLKEYRKITIGDYRLIYKSDSTKNQIQVLALEHMPGNYQ